MPPHMGQAPKRRCRPRASAAPVPEHVGHRSSYTYMGVCTEERTESLQTQKHLIPQRKVAGAATVHLHTDMVALVELSLHTWQFRSSGSHFISASVRICRKNTRDSRAQGWKFSLSHNMASMGHAGLVRSFACIEGWRPGKTHSVHAITG